MDMEPNLALPGDARVLDDALDQSPRDTVPAMLLSDVKLEQVGKAGAWHDRREANDRAGDLGDANALDHRVKLHVDANAFQTPSAFNAMIAWGTNKTIGRARRGASFGSTSPQYVG
jgi:hypothetical protein